MAAPLFLLFSNSAFALLTISPSTIDFGEVVVGSTSGARTVTLTNTEIDLTVTLSPITTTGDFNSITDCQSTLGPQQNCSVTVTFSPQSPGSLSGSLNISGDDPSLDQVPITPVFFRPVSFSVSLNGIGQAGKLSTNTTEVDFGSVPVNSSSSSMPVTLTNSGNLPADISTITASSPFAQTNDCPAMLDAGGSCTIQVNVTPSSPGSVTGSIDISGSSLAGPINESIPLIATATTAVIAVSPSSLSFPQIPVNTTSDPQAVTVQNQGTAPLQAISITTEGEFTQTNDCGTQLPVGGSCTAEVTFAPQTSGSQTGALNVDTGTGTVSVQLSGAGDPTDEFISSLLRPFTGDNPNVIATSEAIANACLSGRITQRMQEDCNAVVGAANQGDAATTMALFQITPESATKANNTTRQGGEAQTRNLGSRISALRSGVRGLSFKGLDLRIDDQNLPIELLAQTYKNSGRHGGGASADNPLLASRLGVFITGDISTGSKDETDLESGVDFDTYGITVGADYRITNHFILGGAVGYIDTDAELEHNAGDLDTQGYSLSLYGTYYSEQNYFVDFSATYGKNDFDQKRSIIYPLGGLNINQSLKADYDGDIYSLFIGSGYDFNRGAWTFGPRADVEYIKSDVDGFTEEISDPTAPGGGWATRIGETDQRWLTLNVGGRASYTQGMDWGVLIPYARLDWLHEFEDDAQIITAHFVSDPAGNAINIETDDPDRDYLRLRIGTSAQFQNGVVGFIDYGTILAHSDWSSHTISAGLRMEF
ncbi:MAG: autotransporter domain-containing protein [Candidatus Thiodiazotropha sp. (ex Dulcina madagascariensis)]|nr:autotransporter domain-containing protein [Candidatus Thiodiazotropha sp. (ex Dulcina madagascariensis)]